MANLTAVFNLVDNISSKLDAIASRGESSVESWERIGEAADTALESGVSAADGIANSVDDYNSSLNKAASTTDSWGDALDENSAALDEMEAATQQAADASDELEDAVGDAADTVEELGKSVDETTEQTEEMGKQSEESGEKMMDAFNVASSALAAAGITQMVKEIAEALLEAADAAAETETAFAKLETIAGSDSISSLEEQIAAVSAEMGIAQDELSDVVYNAISAGSSVEDAVETAAAAAQLATAGFTDTASALSVLSTAMNSYGDAAGTAEEISDSLITVQNLGVTTVAELSSSMGRGISTAAAYNVSLSNLESAYVSVTKAGIATSEATTYISAMMTELGTSSSDVAMILQEETGQSFGELMSSGYSLADVLQILYEYAGEDSEALMNLWGSQTAGVASSAIVNQGLEEFNANLETIQNSSGATAEAYETMADTTEYSEQLMQTAMENLTISIGNLLTPALNNLYSIGAKAFSWMSTVVDEHPALAKVITAVVVGLGSVAVAIAGVSAASAAAAIATTALGTAIKAALGPIALIATAVTAVTAAVLLLSSANDDVYDSTMSMTAVTAAQQDELDELEAEYEEVCEKYGETSEEASQLKYRIDDLTAEIEANGQSVEELVTEVDDLITAHDELMQSYEDATDSIDSEEISNLALIAKLQDLAEASDGSAASQTAMQTVIDSLNSSVDGLSLTYEDLIENTDAAITSARELAEAQAEQERQEALWEEYVELIGQAAEEETELAKIDEEAAAAQERYADASEAYNEKLMAYTANGQNSMGAIAMLWSDEQAELEATEDALDEVTAKQDELNETYSETQDRIAEIEEELGITTDAIDDMTEAEYTAEEAAAVAYQSIQDEVEELCEAYDEAYAAAVESFEGQFGLFDEAEASMDSTVEAAQAALESQLEYWTNYSENISVLKETSADDLGITQENYDALMSYVQDGSEEAAGLAESMVEAIQSGDEEAITELANTLAEVSAAQDEAAQTTADWQTNFTEQMEGYAADMETIVTEDLNLSDEAAAAATETVNSYAASILAGKSSAVSAAQSVAAAVSAALSSTSSVSVSTSVEGNAEGTTDSADVFVAGEEGPELIVDHEGSTVFPAEETQKIIDAVGANSEATQYNTENSYSTINTVQNEYGGSSESSEAIENNYNTTNAETVQNEYVAGADNSEAVENNYNTANTETVQNDYSTAITEAADTEGLSQSINGLFSRMLSKLTAIFDAQPSEIESVVDIEGYAEGTTDSADTYVAGEEGPELIVDHEGSAFPTSETDKLINAINSQQQDVEVVNDNTELSQKADSMSSKISSRLSALTEGISENQEQQTVKLEGYENGTESSESDFVAGENGPELVVVSNEAEFPTTETDKIVAAIDGQNRDYETTVNNYESVTKETDTEGSVGILENLFSRLSEKIASVFEGATKDTEGTFELSAYSSGTTDSADDFIAGEDGPEIVLDHEGSTVFPTSETDRIIGAVASINTGTTDTVYLPSESSSNSSNNSSKETTDKNITLKIEGGGELKVSGGSSVDEESLLSFLYEYLKPVLSEIIQQEIYEEGDLSYGY